MTKGLSFASVFTIPEGRNVTGTALRYAEKVDTRINLFQIISYSPQRSRT